MKSEIKYYFQTLKGDCFKLKNTFAIWTVAIAPLFLTFMTFMIYFSKEQLLIESGTNPWKDYFKMILSIWTIMFYPLFITLFTYLIVNIEHTGNNWKQIYIMPVPRRVVMLSKLTVTMVLAWTSHILLYIFSYMAIYLLHVIYPAIPFSDYDIHGLIFMLFLKVMLVSSSIVLMQYILSEHFKNFIIPLGFGTFATVATMFLTRWEHINKFPYAYPFFSSMDFSKEVVVFFSPVFYYNLGVTIILLIGLLIYNEKREIN